MTRVLGAALAASLLSTTAIAGGVERSVFSSNILFEEGTYSEANLAFVAPNVSGVQASPFAVGSVNASSGDISPDYFLWSFGFKTDVAENLSLALIVDQPIGADVDYAPSSYAYGFGAGSQAVLDNLGVTAIAKYQLPNNFSVYGGVRVLQTKGDVTLFNGYSLSTSTETDFGYLLGAAWEKPEIAARVALTYISAITHDLAATETGAPPSGGDGQFATTIPQQVILEAQTGVAADTLVFGSIRWTNWTAFDITPDDYGAAFGSLVDYDSDVFTYSLGVGRRFNETWSGSLTASYEPAVGGFAGNLGPTDGYFSLGVGATRTSGPWEISAGVRQIWIGDARTENPGASGVTLGDFSGNSGIAGGIRIAYNY